MGRASGDPVVIHRPNGGFLTGLVCQCQKSFSGVWVCGLGSNTELELVRHRWTQEDFSEIVHAGFCFISVFRVRERKSFQRPSLLKTPNFQACSFQFLRTAVARTASFIGELLRML